MLSLFAAVPPLIPTAKLIYTSRWDLLRFLRRLPRLFLAEVAFLLTGIESCPPNQVTHLPFHITIDPKELTRGKLRDQITMSVRSTYQPPLLPELDPTVPWGTTPPHR